MATSTSLEPAPILSRWGHPQTGHLGVYCLLVCSFYEVYIMFLLTDEQLEKIRAKAEAEEPRIGGASFGWNKETGEFEITNEDNGHHISEFEVFI